MPGRQPAIDHPTGHPLGHSIAVSSPSSPGSAGRPPTAAPRASFPHAVGLDFRPSTLECARRRGGATFGWPWGAGSRPWACRARRRRAHRGWFRRWERGRASRRRSPTVHSPSGRPAGGRPPWSAPIARKLSGHWWGHNPQDGRIRLGVGPVPRTPAPRARLYFLKNAAFLAMNDFHCSGTSSSS